MNNNCGWCFPYIELDKRDIYETCSWERPHKNHKPKSGSRLDIYDKSRSDQNPPILIYNSKLESNSISRIDAIKAINEMKPLTISYSLPILFFSSVYLFFLRGCYHFRTYSKKKKKKKKRIQSRRPVKRGDAPVRLCGQWDGDTCQSDDYFWWCHVGTTSCAHTCGRVCSLARIYCVGPAPSYPHLYVYSEKRYGRDFWNYAFTPLCVSNFSFMVNYCWYLVEFRGFVLGTERVFSVVN